MVLLMILSVLGHCSHLYSLIASIANVIAFSVLNKTHDKLQPKYARGAVFCTSLSYGAGTTYLPEKV